MEVSSASAGSTANLQTQVGNSVLRRAMDIQAQTVAQLVNSLPAPQPVSDPTATVGTRVNTYA